MENKIHVPNHQPVFPRFSDFHPLFPHLLGHLLVFRTLHRDADHVLRALAVAYYLSREVPTELTQRLAKNARRNAMDVAAGDEDGGILGLGIWPLTITN